MENVFKKTAKAFSLFLLFAGVSCFLGVNQTVAFQEGFSSRNLTYEETFENGDAWTGDCYAYQQFAGSHSFKAIENPVYMEKFCGKFELRYGDPMVTKNGGPRAEVLFGEQSHRERWYSFAVFFPSYGWKLDMDDEIVSQWHASNGTPPLALRVKNGKLRLRIGHTDGSSIKFNYLEFGDVPKDEWNEFVFHVIHSEKSDGLVEVWKNGQKLATHKGPNLYSDGKHVRWKIGIYKSNWSKYSTDVNLRVTYFDNVRIGDENSTLEDMITSNSKVSAPIPVSGISTTPNTISLQENRQIQISAKISPSDAHNKSVTWSSSNTGVATVKDGLVAGVMTGTAIITAKTQDGNFTSQSSISVTSESQPLSINNFTLIDASTNTSIQTLADGDILEYNQVKDLILNFRAHTFPETIGSVAISLSGPAQSSRTDNGFSYDLLNNDGLRLPKGNYTLSAVPYSERENGGTEGSALSIQFSLTDANKVIIPDCPMPISPTNGSNGVISAVNLEWTESEGSETYSIQVAEDEQFQTNLITLENISGNTAEIQNLAAAKSYFWKVKANNQHGSSTFSEPWFFLTNKETSELFRVTGLAVGPSNLSLDQGNSSILEATVSPSDAQNKMLSWSSSNSSIATVNENGLVTAVGEGAANITATTEDGGFTAVSKVTVSGKEAELAVQHFTMVDAASNTVISKIADGDQLDYGQIKDLSINFRANTFPEKTGSVEFSLEGPVSSSRTDNGFTYDLLSNKGLGLLEGEYTLTATPYSIREKGGDKGATLSIRFTISAPKPLLPGTPQPASPATESAEIPTEVVLDWNQVELADAYEVQVADNSHFIDPVVDQQNINASEWKASGLMEGTQYFWRVRATAETGQSKWSAAWSFQTIPATPVFISVNAVTINPSSLTLVPGTSSTLEASITPSDAHNKKVTWLSADPSVATVDQNGLVNAIGQGTATITTTSEDGGFTAVSTVTVSAKEAQTAVQSFSLVDAASNTEISAIADGDTLEYSQIRDMRIVFRAYTFPEKIGSVAFSLEGPVSASKTDSVFTYDLHSNERLGLAEGEYTLTATPYSPTENGGEEGTPLSIRFSVSAPVLPGTPQLVSPATERTDLPTEVIFDWNQADFANAYEVQVADNSTFSDPVVDQQNIQDTQWQVTGLEEGSRYFWRVRATAEAGQGNWTDAWAFQTIPAAPVIIAVTGVSINPSSIALEQENSSALKVTVSPSDAHNQTVTWSSSDTTVATVDQNGLVNAIGQGTATITTTSEDGGFTAVSTVTVSAKEAQTAVQSFSLVDAASNRVIHTLSDGELIDIHQAQELDLNFRAISSSSDIGSVFLSLTGPMNYSRTDNDYHYELLSNEGLKLPLGKYTITAIPYSEHDKGGAMGVPFSIEFTVAGELENLILQAPELVSPSSGDGVDPNAVQLFWIDKSSSDRYEVQVSKNSGFIDSNVINSGQITNNHLEISGMEPGQVYYWRVRAQKDTIWSDYSSVWNFLTLEMADIQLENPVLVSPAMGEKLELPEAKLSWTQVEHASYYQVYLSMDKHFKKGVITYKQINETSLDISGLANNKIYYWKVEAIYKQESKFSEVGNFRKVSPALGKGAGKREASLSVSMYPNPVENMLNIQLSEGTDGLIQITLAEFNGDIIFSETFENHQGLTRINLSNYNMNRGIYLVSIQTDHIQKVMKLIKK